VLGSIVDAAAGLGHPQLDAVMLEQRRHRRVLAAVERPLVLPDHDRVPAPVRIGLSLLPLPGPRRHWILPVLRRHPPVKHEPQTCPRRSPSPLPTRSLRQWRTGELAPGSQVTSDADLWEYVKLTTGSFSHLVGTCTIGTGERVVADPQLRVRGIAALRVADASVMPSVVAANTNATLLAIAERAEDISSGV
jgi:hypothetical protein